MPSKEILATAGLNGDQFGQNGISRSILAELRLISAIFRRLTGTKKALFLTLVSVHGAQPNVWSREVIAHDVPAEALYAF